MRRTAHDWVGLVAFSVIVLGIGTAKFAAPRGDIWFWIGAGAAGAAAVIFILRRVNRPSV